MCRCKRLEVRTKATGLMSLWLMMKTENVVRYEGK